MSDFIMPADSRDPITPYPSVVGQPPEDGPIIYPPHQPGDPENVVPFQKETGLDPAKFPDLKEALGPKLRLLPGGAGGPNPAVQPKGNPLNLPSTAAIVAGKQVQFADAPTGQNAPKESFWTPTTLTLMALAAAGVGYLIAKSVGGAALNGPLVADMDDTDEMEEG